MSNKNDAALYEFLDYLADKGLMNSATAKARKNASMRVLSILEPNEKNDVTEIDVQDVMARFATLEGQKFTPSSLQVYKSRFKAAVKDFKAYINDPVNFRPALSSRNSTSKPQIKKPKKKLQRLDIHKKDEQETNYNKTTTEDTIPLTNVIPIPIRADLIVKVYNIPFDLKSAEARKIAAVINALAITGELEF